MANSYEILMRIAGQLDGSFGNSVSNASRSLHGLETTAQNTERGANKSFLGLGDGVGKLVKVAAGALGGIGLMSLAKQSVELASDLAEVQNVVDVTFGDSSKKIDDWSSKALSAFGLSELQAKQFNGTMGAMLKSSGITGDSMIEMSEKLSGLSGDLASFYNLDTGDAFDKIRSGISGETEPLKQLGINMSVANMEAFALSQGIKTSYKDMDQAAQTTLRYNYLLNASKDAQGDFTRTQAGFANQARIAKTNLSQLGATMGSKLLPFLNQALIGFNNSIPAIAKFGDKLIPVFDYIGNTVIPKMGKVVTDLTPTFERIGNVVKVNVIPAIKDGFSAAVGIAKTLGDNLNIIIPIVSGVTGAFVTYKTAMVVSAVATNIMTIAQTALNLAMSLSPMGKFIILIGLLIAAGVALYMNWGKISKFLSDIWNEIKIAAGNIFGTISKSIIGTFEGLKTGLSNIWNNLKSFFATWGPTIIGVLFPFIGIPMMIYKNWGAIKTIIKSALDGAIAVAKGFVNDVVGAFSWLYNHNYYFKDLVDSINKAWNTIKSTASTAWNGIKSILTGVWSSVTSTANTVWNGLTGFISGLWNSIKEGARTAWNAITSVLITLWNDEINGLHAIFDPVANFFANVWNTVSSVASTAWNAIKNTVSSQSQEAYNSVTGIFGGIGDFFSGLANDAYNWGANLVNMIGKGITDAVSNVKSSAMGVAQTIGSILGFHSPTKEGPGSDADTWAPNLINMFAGGILGNIGSIKNSALRVIQPVKDAMAGAMSAGGLSNGFPQTIGQSGGISAAIASGGLNGTGSPASSNGSGGGSFVFSPQIIIQGNASEEDVSQVMGDSQRDFEQRMKIYEAEKKRRDF